MALTILNYDLYEAMEATKAAYLATPIEDEKQLRIAGTTFRTLERAYLQATKVKHPKRLKLG